MDQVGSLSSCLICDSQCSPNEEDENDGEIKIDIDFVLQELVEISNEEFARIMSLHGNPSSWSTLFCSLCSKMVRDAQNFASQIKTSIQKLDSIKKQVKTKFCWSCTTVKEEPVEINEDDLEEEKLEHYSTLLEQEQNNAILVQNNNKKIREELKRIILDGEFYLVC
jgi:hypothetical protein